MLLTDFLYHKVNKNSIIYREGDPSDNLYFIISGEVQFFNSEGNLLLTITEGDNFGEEELIERCPRKYYAICKS